MNDKRWKIPYGRPVSPPELLQGGCTPLLSAVLSLRGIGTMEEAKELLGENPEAVHDPFLLTDMNWAVQRIHMAIRRRETVAVYGDYDVDGITSTCLLTDYLQSKGLTCIPYIPDRNEEGYGLNCGAVKTLADQGVRLIITVDCGVTAREEAAFASDLGVDMIITDHHECGGGALPRAVAVIDCKRENEPYPNHVLAGVGVALKLVCACEGRSEEMIERYCDLVAIGTVADVMSLRGENRYLVRKGLRKLETAPRPGIAAMLRESAVDGRKLTASVIGFSLAPRLNAAGRLGHAMTAADLLMTDDPIRATELAVELCALNRQRQSIETEIWNEANAMLSDAPPTDPIVLASDRWHQGVIGIAASRLAEQYGLPAIMICLNDGMGKGSCRSYGGFNLFEALSACEEHLVGFGGHALAAGLNIREEKIGDFHAALAAYYRRNRPEPIAEVQPDLLICDPGLLSLENVRSLDLLEPYGNDNPRPTLCLSGAEIAELSSVGGGKHLRMRLRLRGETMEVIFFSHTAKELDIRAGDRIDLAFTPQINEFRGNVSVQLVASAARRHVPLPLCTELLQGKREVLWAVRDLCPERSDFVRLWRMIDRPGFRLGSTVEDILAQCPENMEQETYCLCLMALREVGLLCSEDGRIFGAAAGKISGKADLEGTALLQAVKNG